MSGVPAVQPFPLHAVVDQDRVRTALQLLAVDPDLGGVVISGRRGTAKTVMARALHALLPPIRVIRHSCAQADPAAPWDWDDATVLRRERLSRTPVSTRITAPFVQVPLGVSEDRLLGSVDVEASVRSGRAVFQPGLLAEAHRGVLCVDDLNLLEPGLADLLLTTVAAGFNQVEREGISFRHPCRPLLIATTNPAEGELRAHLLDRFAMVLSADAPLAVEERAEVVRRVLWFAEDPEAFWCHYGPGLRELRQRMVSSRRRLRRSRITPAQTRYLVEEAVRAGCEGHRADLFAVRAACAHAALQGRERLRADDLREAVSLVILPRSALALEAPPPAQQTQPEPPTDPAAPPPSPAEPEAAAEEQAEPPPPERAAGVPERFLFSPEGVPLDPDLLALASRRLRRQGRSGGQGLVRSQERGRYVKPVLPRGPVWRVALDATLRAAAPHQRARRRRLSRRQAHARGRQVLVREEDLRAKLLARKAGALVVFVVDASGSMALNRMQAAKGAALQLLAEAYRHRDQIALITFSGETAQVQLPPTRSVTAASRRLERLPCGGGSPLAHGLALALRVGRNALLSKDIAEVIIVLISDGKANVGLSRSLAAASGGGRTEPPLPLASIQTEVLTIVRSVVSLGMAILVIDTGSRHPASALLAELGQAGMATVLPLPRATAGQISASSKRWLEEQRTQRRG
ncbi:MAG: magnesium chelatase ATPase subunit D [Prochlorococcaceae cyanobacterium]